MGKVIKKSIKISLVVLVIFLSIPTGIWIVIQNSRVQTFLVDKATTILQDKLGTEVSVGKIDYRPFNKILLRNVFVEDINGDTLVSAETISANLLWFSNSKKTISLYKVSLDNAYINLVTDSTGTMNLRSFLQAFKSNKEKSKESFTINIRNAQINESVFRMYSMINDTVEYGVNFKDLNLSNLNLSLKNISISGDTIHFGINDMSFAEKSGLNVEKFRSELSFSSQHMDFEKLRIQAQRSNLNMPYLKMSYSSWEDMSSFVEKVRLNGIIDRSKVSTKFLSFFVPTIKGFDEVITIEGSFRGPVSDLRIRDLEVNAANSTVLKTSANLTGLPNFKNTFIYFDIKSLSTSLNDIESIENPSTGLPLVNIPDNLYSLDTISYSGNFTGFISDFVAYGTLESAIGTLSMDLSFKPDEENELTNFEGQVSTRELNLGKLINNEILGKTSLEANVKGVTNYADRLEALTDATIFAFEANDYNFRNIELSGNLSNRNFVGSLFLDDPNAKVNFMGKVDFSDTIPVFDFSAFVPKLDLVKLNLNKADSISQASFLLTAKFSGNSLDNSRGDIKVVNCFYKNQNGEIKTSDIAINANNTADSKQVALKSEFLEGELRGKYNYANIFSSFKELIFLYLPALSPDNKKPEIMPSGVENPEYNDYIIKLRVRKTQKLTEVLFPGFRIADNTNVFGIYNPDFQTLTLKVKVPELMIAGNLIRDITIDGQTSDTSFVASITSPQFSTGGTFIRNIEVKTSAFDNNLRSSISWDNKTTIKNQGEILINTQFEHQHDFSKINVDVLSSQFFLNDTVWNVSPSKIVIDSTLISIKDFTLHNNLQKLRVNGSIASLPTDNLRVDLENIDISNINLYSKSLGYEMFGQIDGYAMVTDITSNPLFFADLQVNDVTINNQIFGDLTLKSQWFNEDKRLFIEALNTLNGTEMFKIDGNVFPESKVLDINADIKNLYLSYLEPLLTGNVYQIDGSVSGNMRIGGSFDKPSLNGLLYVDNAGGTIDFTKTRYRMSDQILIENSNILFKNFRLFDVNNRLAVLNGAIRTNYFKDITLDLTLNPSNFQFLNTTERDNELFYGTVFASGVARLTGTPKNIVTNVSVKTEPQTAVFLPLSSSSEVDEYDFVKFLNKSEEIFIVEEIEEEIKTQSNISLTLDLEVTPEAEVQIIIDKQLGDIIRANGAGNLKMEINPTNDVFNMFGEYVIEKGDYLFTLQGVINKRFKIGQGSTINWNGDVEDAIMDIEAIYSLRTTLSPLSPGNEEEIYKRRTQVDCHINLTGKLMEPNIGFDISVPIAENDHNIKALVQDALNTDERMSKQFLSLLVINNFTSDIEPQGTGGFSQGLASTASEMMSNQLSNWLSQWSNSFDIGVNYRPGDEISSQEIEFALSTQLFNDRVTINSNVDMGSQNVNTPIAGDFSIDVKIVPSGKLRLKAFARSNDEIIYGGGTQNDYTTGAGVMYREDFNNLEELWNRYKNFFKRKPKSDFPNNYDTKNSSKTEDIMSSNQNAEKNAFVEIK